MATPTNAVSTLNSKGIREDLENVIYRVAPEEVPFTSSIGKVNVTGLYHEWQVEGIDPVNPGPAQYDGADANIEAGNLTSRLGNYVQHFERSFQVTGPVQAVKLAGRSDELNRQTVLKGLAIKRDVEARFLGNYASAQETPGTTPRASAGALAFVVTNTSRGSGGLSGGFSNGVVNAATAGTSRSFSAANGGEALLKTTLAEIYSTNGTMKNRVAFMGVTQKQEAAAFTGLALNRRDNSGNGKMRILAGADIYVSDFGEVTFQPSIFCSNSSVLVVDTDMWAVGTLRGFTTEDLAKSGDSDKRMILCDKTLVCRNEMASGVIADIQ